MFSNKHVAKHVIKNEAVAVSHKIFSALVENNLNVYGEVFNELLAEVYIPDRSLSDPARYEAYFVSRIGAYKFINSSEESISVTVPDVDTFDWSGLEPIQLAVLGIAGVYYELSLHEFESLLDKGLIPDELLDSIINLRMNTEETVGVDFFLVPEEVAEVLNRYMGEDNKLVLFPFSDSPGIDILSESANRLKKLISSSKVADQIKDKLRRYSE